MQIFIEPGFQRLIYPYFLLTILFSPITGYNLFVCQKIFADKLII
jgi:hypothetical protein